MYTPPELIAELRREAATGKIRWPCILLRDLMPLCDDHERLEQELRETRCLMWMLVHAVGGKVMIPVADIEAFQKEHAWLERTNSADGSLQINAANHAPPNDQIQRAP